MGKMKINREILWRKHESIQAQFREFERWYEANQLVIMDLEEKRQEIVRKYFEFEDGKIKENAQKQYILLKGMDIKDYDKEMESLMSGFEDVERFEFMRLV